MMYTRQVSLYTQKSIQLISQLKDISNFVGKFLSHNEVLRLGNIARALFRRAPKDIPVNGKD